MAENILASSQLTACDILSFPGKVEVDYTCCSQLTLDRDAEWSTVSSLLYT